MLNYCSAARGDPTFCRFGLHPPCPDASPSAISITHQHHASGRRISICRIRGRRRWRSSCGG
eukprot:2176514-Prymnesium_polylepis.1